MPVQLGDIREFVKAGANQYTEKYWCPAYRTDIPPQTIMQRPKDCLCTWTPVLGTEGFDGALFLLKYPSRACLHHYRTV